MSFNSPTFLIFYATVFVLYWLLPYRKQNILLLAASYFFYASWDYRFLWLLILSSTIGYFLGIAIDKAPTQLRRKSLMILGVVLNIGILSYFKYFTFLTSNLRILSHWLDLPISAPAWKVVLPIGISFYLFHTLSYLIDIYRGVSKPNRNFINVSLFVAFFPLLVAGPIERAAHLLPEIDAPRFLKGKNLLRGADLILWGFFKKIFIADNIAKYASQVFNDPASASGITILLATYAFALQIYCDFSGYSDIARGVSKTLGFELNLNFSLPYFSKSPSDFWKRWHISLSSWLRDYLYIGMGGNRNGVWKTYRNLIVTMFLGGLWHGANWTFIIWGCFHGGILVIQRLVHPLTSLLGKAGRFAKTIGFLQIIFMFQVTCIGWLIFRSNSIGDLGIIIYNLTHRFVTDSSSLLILRAILKYGWFLVAVQVIQYARSDLKFFPAHWLEARWAFYLFMLCCIFFMGNFDKTEFIYFQF